MNKVQKYLELYNEQVNIENIHQRDLEWLESLIIAAEDDDRNYGLAFYEAGFNGAGQNEFIDFWWEEYGLVVF